MTTTATKPVTKRAPTKTPVEKKPTEVGSKSRLFRCPKCKDEVKAIATDVSHRCPKNPAGTKVANAFVMYERIN